MVLGNNEFTVPHPVSPGRIAVVRPAITPQFTDSLCVPAAVSTNKLSLIEVVSAQSNSELAFPAQVSTGKVAMVVPCVRYKADPFINLDDWIQFAGPGNNLFTIQFNRAKLIGPDAAAPAAPRMFNRNPLCTSNHTIELDVIALPDDIGAGTTDQVNLWARLNRNNGFPSSGYIGRWINNNTPVGVFQIVEIGVGILAQINTLVTAAEYVKLSVIGNVLTMVARQAGGAPTDSLIFVGGGVTVGHYAGLQCRIGDGGGRVEDAKTIIVDNYIQAAS